MISYIGSVLLGFLLALSLLFWLFYKNYTRHYDYWKVRGVPYEEPTFPFGSAKDHILRKKYTATVFCEMYKKYSKERYFGIYELSRPALVIRDPDLIKHVLVKDFQHFMDRGPVVVRPQHSRAPTLTRMTGQEWKVMRQNLTPTFTSGKMKNMFLLMEKCSSQLRDYLIGRLDKEKPIDVKDVLGRFTMDIIASCAFGLETNSLAGNSEFMDVMRESMELTKPSFVAQLTALHMPTWLKRLLYRTSITRAHVFLTQVVQDAVEYRQKNNITRNDFLDMLINLKQEKRLNEKNNEDGSSEYSSSKGLHHPVKLSTEQMTSLALEMLNAGFESASSIMAFVLFELSRHQDIQASLHQQIKEAVDNNGGRVTYQLLTEIPYLDQIINEVLRLYGTASIMSRQCTREYRVPNSELIIEEGMRVVIPIDSLSHDPQHFPDPYHFRPDRFNPANSRDRHPYVHLPFGEGPRNCIGMRFGLLQIKLGLVTVVLNFKVHLSPDQQIPIQFSPKSLVSAPESPVWIVFNQRTDET